MRVSNTAVAALGVGVCVTLCWAGEGDSPSPHPALESVLSVEASGATIDRRAELAKVSEQVDEVRWHSGQIEVEGNWRHLDELSNLEPSPVWKEYVERRDQGSLTVDRHLRLASWASRSGLEDQARAHRYSVLLSDNNNVQARMALGHTWINGAWYSQRDLKSAADRGQRLREELRVWMPKMKKVAASLLHASPNRQQAALKTLSAIDDPSSIASLEAVCLQLPNHGLPFVKAISKYRSKEACMALCRIALADISPSISAFSVKVVSKYPVEVYVPELLSLLSEPVHSEMQYLVKPNGEMMLRRVLFHETQEKRELVTLDRLVRVSGGSRAFSVNGVFSVALNYADLSFKPTVDPAAAAAVDILADELAAASNALEDQRQFQQLINAHNQRNAENISRISSLLASLTGQELERPADWWDWWREYNYRSKSRKPLEELRYKYVDRPRYEVVAAKLGSTTRHSCLVPGTLIQTNFGLRPIESLCIGDVVIAQNVESGKLAEKVILETTLREPTEITRIQTDAEDILATLGHRWFVPGEGWLMTADLEVDMQLHTATGTARINAIETQQEQKSTHNLVVDDFHTYFVGQSRLLSYDNTSVTPTLRSVPGFGVVDK